MKTAMKRIIGILLILTMLTGVAFSLASCNEDGFEDYEVGGLKFRLPDYFRHRKVSFADVYYSTPEAVFEAQIWTKEEIADEELQFEFDFSITVEELMQFLIEKNGYAESQDYVPYVYDAERDVATFFFFYTDDLDDEYQYNHLTVLKNDNAIYVVRMLCYESSYERFKPMFDALSMNLSVR
jgi:hypothetical protein